MSQDVRDRNPSPSHSDLDEHHAHLRQRGVGERRFGIGAGTADDGAVNGRGHPDHNH